MANSVDNNVTNKRNKISQLIEHYTKIEKEFFFWASLICVAALKMVDYMIFTTLKFIIMFITASMKWLSRKERI
jgi:hypothetical protein